MKRICVPVGCRSDEGLSAPVIKRLRKHFDVVTPQLSPQDYIASYQLMQNYLVMEKPDLVLITGDRVEMCAAASAAFHNRVKIAHFYAGIVNDPVTTFDDIDRHCITLWSDIQFCEDRVSAIRTNMIKQACELQANPYVVGISHLDDLVLDKNPAQYINSNYDLLLINGEPLVGLNYVFKKERTTVQIGSNPDVHMADVEGCIHYGNLPRPQFLGLLKNCKRFITNSSAAIYEAPHFLKPEQIVMVGDRNRNRPRGPFKTGASDKIVEILLDYLK